ncbi:MAG: hypothetical protein AAF809_14490 [Bacteroidota bacterium]
MVKLVLLTLASLASLLPWLGVLIPTVMLSDSGSPAHMARLKVLFAFYFAYPVVIIGAVIAAWVARFFGNEALAVQLAWIPWIGYGTLLVGYYVVVLWLWS